MPITLNGDTGIQTPMYNGTITANAVTPSVNMKNRIINGAMTIDQRNAGASVTVASSRNYYLDRFTVFAQTGSKLTIQQNAGSVTPPAGFTNYAGITVSTAVSPLGAGDQYMFEQQIEGYNVADLNFGSANAKTITLSFWVRSSLTGTFAGSISNGAEDRTYPFTYTISSANTWTQASVTIAGDTTGTWLTTNGSGLRLKLNLGTGTTYSGTANAWTSSAYITSVTGTVNLINTVNATWYITGVQLEVGSTATSFDYRPYGTELALCQRYLPAYVYASASGSEMIGWARGGSAASIATAQIVFPVTARVPPTGISVTGSSYAVSGLAFTTVTFGSSSTNVGQIDLSGGSGMTVFYMYTFTAGATGSKILFTGCEL